MAKSQVLLSDEATISNPECYLDLDLSSQSRFYLGQKTVTGCYQTKFD